MPNCLLRLTAIGLIALTGLYAESAAAQPENQDDIRQSLVEQLKEAGLSRDDINRVLRDLEFDPLQSSGPGDTEVQGEVVRALPDGSPLYLPLGATLDLPLQSGQFAELPFIADGPGMLTIASWGEQGFYDTAVQVLPEGDDALAIDQSGSNIGGIRLIPIGAAGRYIVRIAGTEETLTVAAEWLPFPGLVSANQPKPPDLSDMVTLQPNTQINADIKGDQDRYFMIRPETDGQLIVDFEGNRGDLALVVLVDFDFENPQLISDDDLGGNLSREVATFPVEAGRTYHIRVSPNQEDDVSAKVRTTLIPEPGPNAADQE